MESKANESLVFRTQTTADMDTAIADVIELWKIKKPFEYVRFREAVLKYKKKAEDAKASDPIWLIGQIPPSLEFQIHWMWPGFWNDPKNLTRFFRIFSLGEMPKRKSNVFLVRAR